MKSKTVVFNVAWAFGDTFSLNVRQVLLDLLLKKGLRLIWVNMAKALLADLWFERNQRIFHDKELGWFDCFELASHKFFAWCTLAKEFKDYSIQERCLNWRAFIFPDH